MTTQAIETADKLREALASIIVGRNDTIDLVLTGLIADGHVLLEDYPGSGKTTLSKALGKLIGAQTSMPGGYTLAPFRRIQFTPDMLPGDILGVSVFEPKNSSFRFVQGPIFAHVVLADEINRAGPKVQSAFLECMGEKQVTSDNVTYPLDKLFFVIGTQNPLDIAGTYALPIAQLDRFLLKVPMHYVSKETELEILSTHHLIQERLEDLVPVVSREDVIEAQQSLQAVSWNLHLREAIVDIVQATRNNPLLRYGASTRAALMLQKALAAYAVVKGRSYIVEDDLTTLAPHVLLHRLSFITSERNEVELLREVMAPALEKLTKNTQRK